MTFNHYTVIFILFLNASDLSQASPGPTAPPVANGLQSTITISGTLHGSVYVPELLVGDFDGNGVVDLNDFATFALCYQGAQVPPTPDCELCDLDEDADVDLADFATFAADYTG